MGDSSTSQWQRLLKNAGTWQGSFTKISPQGQILTKTLTEVELSPQDENRAMHQEVRRYAEASYQSPPFNTLVLDYRSLNRGTRFFENGAFSQGSMQWGPFSEFGAELGLIDDNRRLRIVPLFAGDRNLQGLTLIREQLKGTNVTEKPPLALSDLLGTWQGTAITQYADLRPEQQQSTQLTIEEIGNQQIRQNLSLSPQMPPITSVGAVEGQRILFTDRSQSVQVLLLPNGASATCPTQITPRQPLFLEAGWLIEPTTRQRLIRSYDAAGAWVSLTLVTESKI